MSDDFTILNPGCNGDAMDEEGVSYPSAPTTRKRARVQISGSEREEIAEVSNTCPPDDAYGIVTRNVPCGEQNVIITEITPGTPSNIYGKVTVVAADTLTTVSTFTVPVGKVYRATGYTGMGNIGDTRYALEIDGVVILAARTSTAQPTMFLQFPHSHPIVAAGEVIAIKVEHFESGLTGEFEGTILGYLQDA